MPKRGARRNHNRPRGPDGRFTTINSLGDQISDAADQVDDRVQSSAQTSSLHPPNPATPIQGQQSQPFLPITPPQIQKRLRQVQTLLPISPIAPPRFAPPATQFPCSVPCDTLLPIPGAFPFSTSTNPLCLKPSLLYTDFRTQEPEGSNTPTTDSPPACEQSPIPELLQPKSTDLRDITTKIQNFHIISTDPVMAAPEEPYTTVKWTRDAAAIEQIHKRITEKAQYPMLMGCITDQDLATCTEILTFVPPEAKSQAQLFVLQSLNNNRMEATASKTRFLQYLERFRAGPQV